MTILRFYETPCSLPIVIHASYLSARLLLYLLRISPPLILDLNYPTPFSVPTHPVSSVVNTVPNMPSLCDSYDVLLEFTNDTPEAVTIQLLRDYGRGGGGVVLLNSSESVTLVLESGSAYRYAVKMCTRVVSITCVDSSPLL